MSVAEQVIVELTAKVSDYKRNLVDARRTFDTTTGQIEARNKQFSERMRASTLVWGSALGTVIGNVLGQLPGQFVRVIESGLEYAGSLKEQAQQLGVTAKALQEYRFIGSQVGIENEQMEKGLQFLNRSFGQAQDGAKKPIKALQELGFTTKETAQIIRMDVGEAIPLLADKFAAIENPAKRAALEVALFGRAGQQLDNLLTQGSKGVNGLRDAVNELGGVLTDEQIDRADEAADKFAALKTVITARIAGAVSDNADAILTLANSVAVLIDKMAKAIPTIRQFYHEAAAFAHEQQANAFEALHTGFGPLSLPDTVMGLQGRNQKYIQQEREAAARERAAAQGISAGQTNSDLAARFRRDRQRNRQGAGAGPPEIEVTNDDVKAVASAVKAHAAQTGGGTGKSPAELAKEAAQKLQRFVDDQANLQQRINSAMADIAGTEEARSEAEKKNIDIQAESEVRRIKADDDYTAAQKQTLIQEVNLAAAKEKEAIDARRADQAEEDRARLKEGDVRNQRDLLQLQEGLTDDRRARAEIEKRLVDLALEEERIQLETIVNSRTASAAEKQLAQARLATLGDLKNLNYAAIDRQNRSPGQTYLDELHTQMGNVNDQIQNLEIDQLRKLDDYLSSSVVKALGLKGALGEVAQELIHIGLQRALIEPLANMLFGGGKQSSGSGLFSGLLSLFGGSSSGFNFSGFNAADMMDFSSFAGFPTFATGGRTRAGAPISVGERGREVFVPDSDGTIIPNDMLKGNKAIVEVHVVGGENFEAHIIKTAGPVIARASTQAAYGGSKLAQRDLVHDATHRLE